MSGLAALLAGHTPPDMYTWHSAAHVEDIQHAVEHAGWTFCYLDGWTTEDKESFLKGMSATLGLRESLGGDLGALAGALAEAGTPGSVGIVLLWDGWSPLARHDRATFDEVEATLRDRARDTERSAMAVILRGEGPELDLAELPHKH